MYVIILRADTQSVLGIRQTIYICHLHTSFIHLCVLCHSVGSTPYIDNEEWSEDKYGYGVCYTGLRNGEDAFSVDFTFDLLNITDHISIMT